MEDFIFLSILLHHILFIVIILGGISFDHIINLCYFINAQMVNWFYLVTMCFKVKSTSSILYIKEDYFKFAFNCLVFPLHHSIA